MPDELDVAPNLFALAPPASYPVGTNRGSFAAADLDGDGDLDLAVSDGGSGALSILLDGGAGAFGPESRVPVAARPAEVIAAGLARLSIYDTRCRRVAILVDRRVGAGTLSVPRGGERPNGRAPSGAYLYRVTLGSWEKRGKLVLLL